MELRKLLVQKEVVLAEGGKEAATPIVRVCAIAMFRNPFAGAGHVEDLGRLFDIGGALGARLAADAVAQLARPPVS